MLYFSRTKVFTATNKIKEIEWKGWPRGKEASGDARHKLRSTFWWAHASIPLLSHWPPCPFLSSMKSMELPQLQISSTKVPSFFSHPSLPLSLLVLILMILVSTHLCADELQVPFIPILFSFFNLWFWMESFDVFSLFFNW